MATVTHVDFRRSQRSSIRIPKFIEFEREKQQYPKPIQNRTRLQQKFPSVLLHVKDQTFLVLHAILHQVTKKGRDHRGLSGGNVAHLAF